VSTVVVSLLHSLRFTVRSRVSLHLEIIALRHQLAVVNRSRRPRLRLTSVDRMLWAWLAHAWDGWRSAVCIVKAETVVAWHRRGFRLFWTWKSRHRTGRPVVPLDVRALIRDMSTANPLWGAPRIHGELLKLGISVSQSTVATYMRRHPHPPSQTWRTFLTNHASQIMAADFFVVPTITFRLLFVLVILAHDRRRIVHVAVTEHPTAAWTAQQLRNIFSENETPRYLLHDRDSVFADVATTIGGMNIQTVRTAPRSPWQNAFAERVIGSIRRECLDHVIVMNAAGLRRLLTEYVAHYLRSRTHLALGKDTPSRGRSARRQPDA
jgi:transposase InsO family protein